MTATLTAHRVETTMGKEGALELRDLPFAEGEQVEVIVLPTAKTENDEADAYPLRGLPVRYDKPFESVAEEDWDAAR